MYIPPRSRAPRCAADRGIKGTNFLKKPRGVHPTAESSSAVCFLQRSQALWCASYCGVKLRGVLYTWESSSAVCCAPGSQALWCDAHRGSQGYQLSQKTPRCASHCRVKLCGVLPTAESSFAVCCALGSQAPRCASHSGVKIEIYGSLWLLLKGQSGEFLLGVNYSIM